jgi:hypothetical protein
VKREGVRPCLIVEVVSPGAEARQGDLVDKVELYATAGIPEYLIVDSPTGLTGLPFLLLGHRLDAAGSYQPIKPDAEGRFLSETTGIWFQVSPDGQRIFLYEYPTGRRLLNLEEQEERANQETEKALREAQARQAAERKAMLETEARKKAEEKALGEIMARKAAEEEAMHEAEARKAAEEEAARTRAELARLRAELERLRGG